MTTLVKKPAISIVDDDEAVRDSLDAYLTLKGMDVKTFCSACDILEHGASHSDILIIDVNMPDTDGFHLLKILQDNGEMAPVIFITGLGDVKLRARAAHCGVSALLDKPIDLQLLLETLDRLLDSMPPRH